MKRGNYLIFLIISFLFFANCKDGTQTIFRISDSTNCQMIVIGQVKIDSLMSVSQKPFRKNLLAIDFQDEKTKFRLALSDENQNGTYTDSLIDKAFLLEYGKDSVRLCMMLSVAESFFKPEMLIVSDGEYYSIKEQSSEDLSFEIKHLEQAPSSNPDMATYSKINHLKYPLLFGGEGDLQTLLRQDKLVYIEFWGTWCKGCIQIVPDLKLLSKKYSDKLMILGMNAKDDLEDAKKFVQANQLNWTQGIANEEITGQLLVAGYPFGILLDSDGNLIEKGIKPERVIQKYLK